MSILETLELRLIMLILGIFVLVLLQKVVIIFLKFRLRTKKKSSKEIINTFKISIRIFTFFAIIYLVFFTLRLSIESIFGFSAIIGAIISFSSVQWISNFIAGLYILLIRPIAVSDFIKISDEIKGEIVEIALNYTKIRTSNNIFHLVPNRMFLRSNIINYNAYLGPIGSRKKDNYSQFDEFRLLARRLIENKVVRYTFLWGAPIADLNQTNKRILKICEIYAGIFGFKPEFFLTCLGFRMQYTIIVTTHSPTILLENIQDFRNDLITEFY